MLELEGEGWRSAYFRPNFQALEHYFGRNLQHFSDHSVLSNSSGVLCIEQTRNRAYVENPGTDQFLIGGRVVQLRQHD